MRVVALIELLLRADPDAEVVAYDADEEDMIPVTGVLYGSDTVGIKGKVEITTDDMNAVSEAERNAIAWG